MDERQLHGLADGVSTSYCLAVMFAVGARGTHEHRYMTMVDRCGALDQQLAAALASSQLGRTAHATHSTLQQKWAFCSSGETTVHAGGRVVLR